MRTSALKTISTEDLSGSWDADDETDESLNKSLLCQLVTHITLAKKCFTSARIALVIPLVSDNQNLEVLSRNDSSTSALFPHEKQNHTRDHIFLWYKLYPFLNLVWLKRILNRNFITRRIPLTDRLIRNKIWLFCTRENLKFYLPTLSAEQLQRK